MDLSDSRSVDTADLLESDDEIEYSPNTREVRISSVWEILLPFLTLHPPPRPFPTYSLTFLLQEKPSPRRPSMINKGRNRAESQESILSEGRSRSASIDSIQHLKPNVTVSKLEPINTTNRITRRNSVHQSNIPTSPDNNRHELPNIEVVRIFQEVSSVFLCLLPSSTTQHTDFTTPFIIV
jgi:hypothetical protein